jgi:hypothetical protein
LKRVKLNTVHREHEDKQLETQDTGLKTRRECYDILISVVV